MSLWRTEKLLPFRALPMWTALTKKVSAFILFLGEMVIQGKDLHIDSMSVETGDMTINGDIWSIVYGDKDRKSPLSLLGKLFR